MVYGILSVVLASVMASAASSELTVPELRERLQVQADMYLMDSSGKKIVAGPLRTNFWKTSAEKGEIKSDWSSNVDSEEIALRHSWQIQDDGSLKVSIEEFAKVSGKNDPVLSDPLGKSEFVVENFAPVTWRAKSPKKHTVVIRFVPSLREISRPVDVDNLPVAGTGITVSDSSGFLWAQDVTFGGKYSGMTSHRGTLALSYSPFAGAKEMGFAEGNQIILNIDKKYQINLKAATSFLPAGVTAKVYAIYMPEKKSKGFNSLHTFDTSREERIKEVMRK